MVKLAMNGGKPIRKCMLIFQQPEISKKEIWEVVDTLESGWIGTGPKVQLFSKNFLEYKQTSYGIPLSSCTSALFLALKILKIKPGDEVITTPMTFGSTANVIEHLGATVVFADCNKYNFNISPDEIENKITDKTKAVIIVHFAGRPCDMDRIVKICNKNRVYLIEDCAHAVESTYKGRSVGTFGDFGCFSFYATKNLFTGEGGFLTIKRKNHLKIATILSNHGMSSDAWKRYSDKGVKHYRIVEPGYKMNMMDIQASLGIHQLKNIDDNRKKREEIWHYYNDKLMSFPCKLPESADANSKHAYHLYSILLDLYKFRCNRDEFYHAMQYENIGVGVHYIPLHRHPFYRNKYGYKKSSFPQASYIGSRTLSLNIKPTLKKQDLEDIISALNKLFEYFIK